MYTKSADDSNWRYSYYDFDELLEKDCILPEETERQPPWLNLPDSGTIVVMENVDQADYVRGDAIVAMLLKNLGRVYRMFLPMEPPLQSVKKERKNCSDERPSRCAKESEEVQNLGGPSKGYGEIVIEFDEKTRWVKSSILRQVSLHSALSSSAD